MKNITTKFLIFCATSALAIPAVGALDIQNADAFSLFKKSSKSSKRSSRKSSSSKSKKKSKSSSNRRTRRSRTTTTTRRRTTTRSTPRRTRTHRTRTHRTNRSRGYVTGRRRHTTSNRRPVNRRHRTHRHSHRRNRVTTHTTHRHTTHSTHQHNTDRDYTTHRTTRSRTHYRSNHHIHAPRRRRTVVRHHHYYGSGDTSGGSVASSGPRVRQQANPAEVYVVANAGLSGFVSQNTPDRVLPGSGVSAGIGAKRGWLGGELGLNLSAYKANEAAPNTDLNMLEVSADLKIQPSFAFIEPFALVGAGVQTMEMNVDNSREAAAGLGLRMGGGVDVRIYDLALTAQYTYRIHGLSGDTSERTATAQSDMLTIGAKLYF